MQDRKRFVCYRDRWRRMSREGCHGITVYIRPCWPGTGQKTQRARKQPKSSLSSDNCTVWGVYFKLGHLIALSLSGHFMQAFLFSQKIARTKSKKCRLLIEGGQEVGIWTALPEGEGFDVWDLSGNKFLTTDCIVIIWSREGDFDINWLSIHTPGVKIDIFGGQNVKSPSLAYQGLTLIGS